MISIVQAWISQSRVSFLAGLAVHLVMFAVLVVLFYRRIVVLSFFRLRNR
jgi:hypothetical protein